MNKIRRGLKTSAVPIPLVLLPLLAATACGALPNLPGTSSEAEVSVVNAQGTEGKTGSLASAAAENAEDEANQAGETDEDAQSGLDDPTAEPDPDENSSGEDGSTGGPQPDEVADAEAITLVTDEDRMSTNPRNLTRGWGFLDVDGATTTTSIEGQGAAAGFKYLVVDYQLFGGDGGNLFDGALRVIADEEVFRA